MFELIRSNKRRSVALVGSFVLVAVIIGAVAGYLAGFGPAGAIVALVISARSRESSTPRGSRSTSTIITTTLVLAT